MRSRRNYGSGRVHRPGQRPDPPHSLWVAHGPLPSRPGRRAAAPTTTGRGGPGKTVGLKLTDTNSAFTGSGSRTTVNWNGSGGNAPISSRVLALIQAARRHEPPRLRRGPQWRVTVIRLRNAASRCRPSLARDGLQAKTRPNTLFARGSVVNLIVGFFLSIRHWPLASIFHLGLSVSESAALLPTASPFVLARTRGAVPLLELHQVIRTCVPRLRCATIGDTDARMDPPER